MVPVKEVLGTWSINRVLWVFHCQCTSSKNVIPMDWTASTCSTCHVKGVRPERSER